MKNILRYVGLLLIVIGFALYDYVILAGIVSLIGFTLVIITFFSANINKIQL